MRKIFYESIVILLILLLSMPINMTVYATRNEDIHRLSIGLNAFFEVGDGDKLTERTGTSHMAFVEDMRNSAEGTLAMNVLGWIYGTGAEPDEEKYMKVLINIMKTHEMETAGEISDQHEMDNLKAIQDYGMDALSIGIGLLPGLEGVSEATKQKGEWIKIAIGGLNTMMGNTTQWIKGISDLETIIHNYAKHDEFLALIELQATGELKSAATALRNAMSQAMDIKLKKYAEISEGNFVEYTEYFFEDVFIEALKLTDLYEKDSVFKGFVEIGGAVNQVYNALKLGKEIGEFIGNLAIGAENIIDRVMEMKAVYDISKILEGDLSRIQRQFTKNYSEWTDALAEDYMMSGSYLISSRIRGEYCMYSMLAKDAGLYSYFGDETAQQAERVYNRLTNKLEQVGESLESISNVLIVDQGSETPYRAVNTQSEWQVLDVNGDVYDNYTLKIYDKQSLLNFVRLGPVDEADPTVTEYKVTKAEPLKISLEKGYAYTFEFTDNNDPEKIKFLTVGITTNNQNLTELVGVESKFGKNSFDTFKMVCNEFFREKKYETHWNNSFEIPTTYALLDINKDGYDEIIISSEQSFRWAYFQVYKYDDATRMLNILSGEDLSGQKTTNFSAFKGIYYSNEKRALVYTNSNNGVGFGSLGYYSVGKDYIDCTFYVGWETDGNGSVNYYTSIQENITEKEYFEYLQERVYVEFRLIESYIPSMQ